ncbi:MAG TPA: hypothetical protein VFF30_16905 [Nitrososphaerales archaeon]|nr:hypothetical protein [Nitrososphaerales archaeon]
MSTYLLVDSKLGRTIRVTRAYRDYIILGSSMVKWPASKKR